MYPDRKTHIKGAVLTAQRQDEGPCSIPALPRRLEPLSPSPWCLLSTCARFRPRL